MRTAVQPFAQVLSVQVVVPLQCLGAAGCSNQFWRLVQVQSAVDVLTSHPLYLYSAAGVPLALVLLAILSSLFGGKKVPHTSHGMHI